MDFSIPRSTQDVLDRARAFLDAEVVPREPAWSGQGFFTIEPELKALRAKVREAGLWAPLVPKELGGSGEATAE